MANTLPTDSNSVLYEGVRDPAGGQFVAKAAGTVTTDAGGVKSAPQMVASTDGAQATIGTTTDAAYAGSGASSVVALLKGVYAAIKGLLTAKIVDAGGTNQLAVDATGKIGVNNFPATQAISAASLPLPTGAAVESGGHLATIDTSTAAVNTATGTQADAAYTSGNGSMVALLKGVYGKLANGVATNAAAGTVVALTTPPATLTAGVDTSLTFGQQVRHVYVQNKSASDVNVAFDATASAGTYIVPGGSNALLQYDVPCTVLHAYCAVALNVNGASGGNLVVEGRL